MKKMGKMERKSAEGAVYIIQAIIKEFKNKKVPYSIASGCQ